MTTFLVVRVVDVTENPVNNALVQVAFDGNPSPAPSRSQPGVYEVAIPTGAQRARLFIQCDGYWDVSQLFRINQGGRKPTLLEDGPVHVNVRGAYFHSRDGSDVNLEVNVVLGQLRDTSQLVSEMAAPLNLQLSLQPTRVTHWRSPILIARGNPMVDGTEMIVRPPSQARVWFAERLTVPRLLAIVDPGWGDTSPDAPYHYNVFFPPRPDWAPGEPFTSDDVDMIGRYVLGSFNRDAAQFYGKALAYQNLSSLPKCIFVFPVGTRTSISGDLTTQDALARFMKEVHYWVQRIQGIRFPRHKLGAVAVSYFSEAGASLLSMITGPRNIEFYNRTLQGVFVFDGVFGMNRYDPAEFATCARALGAWHRAGRHNRSLRVYTQYSPWWDSLKPFARRQALHLAPPPGTREISDEDQSLSVLFMTTAAWRRVLQDLPAEDWRAQRMIHQAIPAMFMEHAVNSTTFSR